MSSLVLEHHLLQYHLFHWHLKATDCHLSWKKKKSLLKGKYKQNQMEHKMAPSLLPVVWNMLQQVFVISCKMKNTCYDITNRGVATSAACLEVWHKKQCKQSVFLHASVWIYSVIIIRIWEGGFRKVGTLNYYRTPAAHWMSQITCCNVSRWKFFLYSKMWFRGHGINEGASPLFKYQCVQYSQNIRTIIRAGMKAVCSVNWVFSLVAFWPWRTLSPCFHIELI